MALAAGRTRCVICEKEKATSRCGGCSQDFCFNHLAEHHQQLSQQLDKVENSRDLFEQTLNNQKSNPQKPALIERIDGWERESIKLIQQTAEEARQKLLTYTTDNIKQLEIELNTLNNELKQHREENDFSERDLNHWNEEIARLTRELNQPDNIILRQDTLTFINKISIDIVSKSPSSISKSNSDQIDTSHDSQSVISINNNDENTRSNSDAGLNSRNSDPSNDRDEFGIGDGTFKATNDNNSREIVEMFLRFEECDTFNKIGHVNQECPEPWKGNRGGGDDRRGFRSRGGRGRRSRGEFNSNNGDRNVSYMPESNDSISSMSVTFRNSRNQNDSDPYDNGDFKPALNGWEDSRENESTNGNSFEDSSRYRTLNTSSTDGRRFRGGRGVRGFHSGTRGNRGSEGGSSNRNYFNYNKSGYGSQEGSNSGSPNGGDRRNGRASGDIFEQGSRRNAQAFERYIPPTTENEVFGEAVSRSENLSKYHPTFVKCTPEGRLKPIDLYEEANLSTQILSNIRNAYFVQPTAIQRYTIPCIRQQDDIMACVPTRSDKTAAFLLPIISNLLEYHTDDLSEKNYPPSPLCLIISPTRELATQIEQEARKFAFGTAVIPCLVIGGDQKFAISDRLREGCHIVSATAGRLKDIIEKSRISLKKVKYLVLNEADRMLVTGFEPDIHQFEELGLPPKNERFTAVFFARFSEEMRKSAEHFLHDNYIFLTVSGIESIKQTIEEVRRVEKEKRLIQLLKEHLKFERCLIFVETDQSADDMRLLLFTKQLKITVIHGSQSVVQKNEALQQFTNRTCPILVATSVAVRDLDLPSADYVINYDLPALIEFYIHHISRAGHDDQLGKSISFFDPDRDSDRDIASDLVSTLSRARQEVPEFLKQYARSSTDAGGYGGRNTDMRARLNDFDGRNQETSLGGGTSFGWGEEHWID